MANNDELFEEVDVFRKEEMMVKGLSVTPGEEKTCVIRSSGENGEGASVVVPLDFGATYLGVFGDLPEKMCGTLLNEDPRLIPAGEERIVPANDRIPVLPGAEPRDWETFLVSDFLVTPTAPGQFLILDFGPGLEDYFWLFKFPILLGHDTDDDWFRPGPQKDLNGGPDSYANWEWTSDEVLEHIYEPLRKAHPEYITRRPIGKDDTGTYEMWCYTFEPEDYEQTILVTGGMHAAEMDGYLALGRLMELIVNEDGTQEGLHYLRTKVKLVVVPIINVYSASVGHERRNGRNVDLNRDFGEQSQAETRNVVALFKEYQGEAAALIDYHTSKLYGVDLYYQFSIEAPNSALCRRVTNHIYEDLKARNLLSADPVDISRIPGGLYKDDKYLQGFVWNHLGIPTLVVEHEHQNYAPMHSALGTELAVEYYGNFLIETAKAKLKLRQA